MYQLVPTTVRLRCGNADRRGLPPTALGSFYRWLPEVTQRTLGVALRGASTKAGRKPAWWSAATEVRWLDQTFNQGEATVTFGAPRLGEAAEEIYQQQMIDGIEDWRPSRQSTVIDLMSTALADVLGDRPDSDRLDDGVLVSFGHLDSFLGGNEGFAELVLPARTDDRHAQALPEVHCDATAPERAKSWHKKTPQPRSARVAGVVTMIDTETNRFALNLDDGKRVFGIFTPDDFSPVKKLVDQRVTVFGKVLYRPTGAALRLDVEGIEADPQAATFFSRLPEPPRPMREQLRQQSLAGKGSIEGLFGVLAPGPDESDDEDAFIREVEAVS
jgi:hypothetical protein